MRELLTKYVLAMITASIAFIEPTFNFLYAIVAVITIDCFSAYNLNRRIRRKFPNYATGKLESKKALKMIYTIGKVYGVILGIWFIEKNIIIAATPNIVRRLKFKPMLLIEINKSTAFIEK